MSRATLRIKIGSYTGDGSASRTISGVGFQPKLVFFLPNTGTSNVFKLDVMPRNTISYQGSVADNTAGGIVHDFFYDGFTIGSSTGVNGNGVLYCYMAIAGSSEVLATGTYIGDGADDRNYTDASKIGFTPTFLYLRPSNAGGAFRTSVDTGDSASPVNSGNATTNYIQSLYSGGFQLGSSANTNANAIRHWYWALGRTDSSFFKAGTFTGNGTGQSITGVGFTPDFLWVKSRGGTAGSEQPTVWMSGYPTGYAKRLNAVASSNDAITSVDTDGFTVGTQAGVNESGDTIQYIAIKQGNWIYTP